MKYLVNPDRFKEIDERETDPLTRNIIGTATVLFSAIWNLYSRLAY